MLIEYSRMSVPSLNSGHEITNSRNCMLPKRRFWKEEQKMTPDFRLTFQLFVAQIEYSRLWKVLRKSGCHLLFIVPKSSFGRDKILEGLTKGETQNFMLPKRRFWKAEPIVPKAFSKHFSRAWVLNLGHWPLKSQSKSGFHLLFLLPKSSFGEHRFWKTEHCQPCSETRNCAISHHDLPS